MPAAYVRCASTVVPAVWGVIMSVAFILVKNRNDFHDLLLSVFVDDDGRPYPKGSQER